MESSAEIELLVCVDVDDLERAIQFYNTGLGLRLVRRLYEGTVAEMAGAAVRIFLLAKPAGSVASAASAQRRDYGRHWTPVHLDFVVVDFGAALERVVAAGATLEGQVETADWGRIAYLADPFGNGLCLLEFSARGYDAVAS